VADTRGERGEQGIPGQPTNPVPDPTFLTTQALYREVAALRELFDQRISSLNTTSDARMTTLETVFSERLTAWQKAIGGQFDIIERQRVEQKTDTKQALDAALQAAKDAVALQTEASDKAIAKSETATNKALDQLSITFNTATDSLRRELGELKERVVDNDRAASSFANGVAGANTQRLESRQEMQWSIGTVIAIGAALFSSAIAITAVGVAVVAIMHQ
jgi:hypothetical protein